MGSYYLDLLTFRITQPTREIFVGYKEFPEVPGERKAFLKAMVSWVYT